MRYPCRPLTCWAAVVATVVCLPVSVLYVGKATWGRFHFGQLKRELIQQHAEECESKVAITSVQQGKQSSSLRALQQEPNLFRGMLRQLLAADDESRFLLGTHILQRLGPWDAVPLARNSLERGNSDLRRWRVLMSLAFQARPEYADLFGDFVGDGDLRVRSASMYGLFRCGSSSELVDGAARSLQKGLEVDYYGTDEIIQHEDSGWRSAAAYLRFRPCLRGREVLVDALRGNPPSFIKRDILRAFIEQGTSVGIDYSRATISSEGDLVSWGYMAQTILRFGTPEERTALLSSFSLLPETRRLSLADSVLGELASFHLPLELFERHPSSAREIAHILESSTDGAAARRHMLGHLRLMAGNAKNHWQGSETSVSGKIEAKKNTRENTSVGLDFEGAGGL